MSGGARVTRRRYQKRLEPSERRESILDSALALITRTESFAVTMAQVAEEEGVSKPVVYDHFANVEQLVAELFAREGSLAIEPLLAQLSERDESIPVEERLGFALTRFELYFDLVAERPDRWRLALVPPIGLTPESRSRLDMGKRLVHDTLLELIAWAVPHSSDLDLDLITHTIEAVAERMAQLLILEEPNFSVERAIEFAISQVGAWTIGRESLRTLAPGAESSPAAP